MFNVRTWYLGIWGKYVGRIKEAPTAYVGECGLLGADDIEFCKSKVVVTSSPSLVTYNSMERFPFPGPLMDMLAGHLRGIDRRELARCLLLGINDFLVRTNCEDRGPAMRVMRIVVSTVLRVTVDVSLSVI
jgi:hypothetical protein